MIRREWQSLRVEIIDSQVAVRVNDDWPCAFLDCRRVNAIAEALLDDDGVSEITFRLREQVANGDGLARARHSEQHGMLRCFVVVRAGKSFDADEVVVRADVNRL